jgi:hypothetical protein
VQDINRPSSSNVPQDDEKNQRHANENTFVSHEQAMVQAKYVDVPRSSSQVVDKRSSSLLQSHPQDFIIRNPSKGLLLVHKKLIHLLNITLLFLVWSLLV